jgi:hypothetical protein
MVTGVPVLDRVTRHMTVPTVSKQSVGCHMT